MTVSSFFLDLQQIASLISLLIHLLDGFFHRGDDLCLGDRLCQITLHAKIDRLFCIIKLVISRYYIKKCCRIEFSYFPHCLDPVDSRHMNVHKDNVRMKSFCFFCHCSSCLGSFCDTAVPKCTGYHTFESFQHNSLVICYQYTIHCFVSPPLSYATPVPLFPSE